MKTLRTALILFALMCVVLGIIYPLMITGIAQVVFPFRANGSLIISKGGVIGSELIGQKFLSLQYFQGRPSASEYDGGSSGGSNLGPTSEKWQELVTVRILEDAHSNILSSLRSIPSDLVTASASGLDPHISIEAAMTQIPRIAQARSLDESLIRSFVMKNTEKPFFGPHCVNVVKLNLALDNYETINKRMQP